MNTTSYDVFLFYNSTNQDMVEIIARRLLEEADLQPFLDRWHLVPDDDFASLDLTSDH